MVNFLTEHNSKAFHCVNITDICVVIGEGKSYLTRYNIFSLLVVTDVSCWRNEPSIPTTSAPKCQFV